MALREIYTISGRVIDAETGKPVAGVLIGHGRTSARGNQGRGNGGNNVNGGNRRNRDNGGDGGNRSVVISSSTDGMSGPEGEFKIQGVSPGSYAVFLAQDQSQGQTDFYSDPVGIEISSLDVSDVEIKLHRGVSINGVVVIDAGNDPQASANSSNIVISAQSRGGRSGIMMMNNANSPVAANGSFRISGLSPGLVNLNVRDMSAPGPFSGLTVLRIERNGADVQSGLRVEPGEQVTGVRVLLSYGRSVIRGVVRVEGGPPIPGARLMVSARRVGANTGGGRMNGGTNAPVDLNGRFQLERLVAGTYEVSAQIMGGNRFNSRSGEQQPQTVNVGTGTVQDIVVPLKIDSTQRNQNGNRPQGRQRGGRP
jgi:hypothetical protein